MKQKKHLIKLIIAIVIIYLPTICSAQWEHIYTHDQQIYALDVVNSDTVYVVGQHCAIRTFDGGETWNDINYNCNDFVFNDVNFPTPQVGYIISNLIILKTENYGNDWQQVAQDTVAQLVEAEFINPDTGWIIGNYTEQGEVIMRTYDGGINWNYYYPVAHYLTDIQMLNSNIGYITHWYGILKTIDGGNSWFSTDDSMITGFPMCCSFINPDTGFVGSEGLFKTENGGADWTFLTNEHWIGYLERSQLQFINNDTGYYAGFDGVAGFGKLCTTTDGGYNWNEGQGAYYDIEMYNIEIGYCIEWTGEIHKTTNGGIVVGVSEQNNDLNPIIYPNPFNNELFINISATQTQYNKPIIFDIFDIIGNKVFSKYIETPNDAIHNLNRLQPGIYLFSIKSENIVLKSGKLFKTKK